ncbi:hypothetical protein F8203_gp016 [Heliothis virescens ascovirus 3f]|uniref:Uncharacterized protein n=1 Tax=Heliothis virescens ascovirus 3f TaxID=328614 RepID=A0A171PVB3_9VIRU|nr:hypothetical protein F8203_gp016 [Heliothis virescens ascovirus 3f]AJP08982.1 hypothetical protein [Heliothis virescens ascovirus 3f]
MTDIVIDTRPVWGNLLPQLKWKDGMVVLSEDNKRKEPYGICKFYNFKEDFHKLYFKLIVNNPQERKTIEVLISLPSSIADVCSPSGYFLGGRTLVNNVPRKFAIIRGNVDAEGKVGYYTSDLDPLGVRCKYDIENLVKNETLMKRIILDNTWKSKYPTLVKPYEKYLRAEPKTIILPTNPSNTVRSNVDIKPVNPPSSGGVKTIETDERLKDPPHRDARKTVIPVPISEQPVVVKTEIKSLSKEIRQPDPQPVVVGKIIETTLSEKSSDSRSLFASPILLICVASVVLLLLIS